jgi:hypothetical protein
MWVTVTLVVLPVVILGLVLALGTSTYRRLDHDLQSLAACFKID